MRLEKNMLKTILSLAWPTMLEELLQTTVQYMDTFMVGVLGTAATAAVGATTTVNWLINGTVNALGVGFLSFIAKSYGAGEKDKAAKASAQAAGMSLIVGLFLTIVTVLLHKKIPQWMQVDAEIMPLASRYFFILYLPMIARTAMILFGNVLRAVGDTKTPMRVGFIVNMINVVLNFLLIFPSKEQSIFGLKLIFPGAGLGVIGAAIASAISFVVGGLLITVKVWHHPLVSPKHHSKKPNAEILRPCLKTALPNMLQRFATSFGYVAFASMINSLGSISTAAHTIANTVESAFYIPGYGMQAASATLAGNALGAKNEKQLRSLGQTLLPLEVSLMMITGGLLFLFAPALMKIFSADKAVIQLGTTVLRMVAVSEPFYGVSIIVEGMLLGMGKPFMPFLFNIIGMWGIRIVGTFVCTQLLGLGLVSAWACMIAHNLFLFVMYLWLYLSGRWNPMAHRAQKQTAYSH